MGERQAGSAVPPLRGVLLVAVGGAVGALARAGLAERFPAASGEWPWATFATNVSGAFALGLLLTVLAQRFSATAWARPLLGTGVLGAFTTFATVGLELHLLVLAQRPLLAATYVTVTAAAGLLAAAGGIAAGRRWREAFWRG